MVANISGLPFKQVRSLKEDLSNPGNNLCFLLTYVSRGNALLCKDPGNSLNLPIFNVPWVSSWDIQLAPMNKKPVNLSGLYIDDSYK